MLIVGVVGSGVYKVLLLLHIGAVLVAFAPAVVHALAGPRLMKVDEPAGRHFAGVAADDDRTVHLPALLAVGVLGFALVGASGEAWKLSDPWVFISAILWLVIGAVIGAVIIPGNKKVAGGDRAAESRVAAAGGIASLLLVVVLFLMVVKPG